MQRQMQNTYHLSATSTCHLALLRHYDVVFVVVLVVIYSVVRGYH